MNLYKSMHYCNNSDFFPLHKAHLCSFPINNPSQSLQVFRLLLMWMHWSCSWTSNKKNHEVRDFYILLFTKYYFCEIQPHSYMLQRFLLFSLCLFSLYEYITISVIHPTVSRHLSCFLLFGRVGEHYYEQNSMDILVHVFREHMCFSWLYS